MKLRTLLSISLIASQTAIASAQEVVAHFDMSLTDNDNIVESYSKSSYKVSSQLPPFTVKGLDGEALRFDGYSNEAWVGISAGSLSKEALTVSIVLAAEAYPMMKVDVAEDTPTFATIFGNLDEDRKKGFCWQLSSQGDLRFRYGSATGFLMTVNGDRKLPRGQWAVLTAVLDKANNAATIYLNGEAIGTGRMSNADIAHGENEFTIGKDKGYVTFDSFWINTFCGLIDDIIIYNGVVLPSAFTSTSTPDFSYPASRYTDNPWRPQFHGMPSGSWTNETHGMTYSDGRYHVFFQKNANGPYMSRLHWGHISSENLYDWHEEPIAIAPGESYDIKGCWSGCIYDNNGTPTILYTAVDNAKATIAQAKATDNSLSGWEKQGVIINGRPTGLSDDFRDPYYFEAGGQKYIIVGTSKNNIGACTLHKYENGTWTNDGTLFFQGTSANQHGTFWEMPNVTPMGNGKWLFTCTPLSTGVGVRTLCWVGAIGTDGKFTPDGEVQYLEMGGISRDGYGLLSPTICQKDGKTLLMGIVPDKLSSQQNFEMGWAHNYSLPREISIASDGTLIQKPFSGLDGLRSNTSFSKDITLLGSESLSPVSGRQIELLGEFNVASGACGFNFLKSGAKQVSLTYDCDNGTLTLDMTQLDRTANDRNSYNGTYSATLPKKVSAGEKLILHVYLDGSIADIFVNDMWAFSVRLFPTNASQTETEVFATTQMQTKVKAWTLKGQNNGTNGIEDLIIDQYDQNDGNYYDLHGHQLINRPQKGVYIHKGKKYVGR